jgi:4-amino-4-deoxy-L-arabinose transferase-like glycosyltransferase
LFFVPIAILAASLRANSPYFVSDSGYLLRLLAVLGAILLLRIVSLHFANMDLGRDEAQYWTWSRELAFGYFSKPPMIAWVIRVASEFCGNSEACLRTSSPVIYTIASFMIYLAGRELYGPRVGFWSAIIFDTLPGVSLSSNLITTDVPLILFWSIALYFWVMLVQRQSIAFAVLFGLSVGLGLLAKQAMIYAIICVALHAAISREARQSLQQGRGLIASLVALALFSPNVLWNAQHGFPTAKHTATNMGWKYPYFHLGRGLEYIGNQFVVFGPILFTVLLRSAWRAIRGSADSEKILLLSFSMPVLGLVLIQSFLSKAHGNWSATAYPAASILVTQVMLELGRTVLFRVSLALHLAVAVGMAIAPSFARQWPVFEQLRSLNYVVGWRDAAEAVRTKLGADNYGSILVDTRELASELRYYLRDVPTPLYVWPSGPTPTYHDEMTRPFTSASPEPVLLVSLDPCPAHLTKSFGQYTSLGEWRVRLVKAKWRSLHFCRLADYRVPGGSAK